MFLRAGFNFRHRRTGIVGWTRDVRHERQRFAVAELVHMRAGDLAWLGAGDKFLVWGDAVVFGTWPEIDLPRHWQDGLPQSPYPTPKTREPSPVKLVLPYPISANRYWISFYAHKARRVFTGPTKEAEAYKEECGWRAKEAGVRTPFACPVALNVLLVPENRICMDLDNALKVTLDALKGVAYDDDRQVMRIVAERADPDPVGGKRIEIEVLPHYQPIALEAAA